MLVWQAFTHGMISQPLGSPCPSFSSGKSYGHSDLCTVENKTLLDFDLSLMGGLLIIFNDNKKLEQMKEEEGML